MTLGVLLARDTAQADELARQVRASATKLQAWIASTRLPQLERSSVQVWSVDV